MVVCEKGVEGEPELKQWVRVKEPVKGLQRDQRVKSAGREVIVIQEAGAPELKPVVQPGLERELVLEQELVQERKSASQISEQMSV